jgi:hypothetical protein
MSGVAHRQRNAEIMHKRLILKRLVIDILPQKQPYQDSGEGRVVNPLATPSRLGREILALAILERNPETRQDNLPAGQIEYNIQDVSPLSRALVKHKFLGDIVYR